MPYAFSLMPHVTRVMKIQGTEDSTTHPESDVVAHVARGVVAAPERDRAVAVEVEPAAAAENAKAARNSTRTLPKTVISLRIGKNLA